MGYIHHESGYDEDWANLAYVQLRGRLAIRVVIEGVVSWGQTDV